MSLIILTSIIFSIIFFQLLNTKIALKLNLFDVPNIERKIHKEKVPLTGGIFFLIIIFSQYFILFLNEEIFLFKFIYLVIFFICTFFIGFRDDLNNLKPLIRIIITSIILILFLSIDTNYNLNEIKIFVGDFEFYKKTNTTFLTVTCILCLIILFNMVDGLDGLAITIFLTWYIYFFIFYNLDLGYNLIIFITSLIFLFYNMKKKVFLGSSGNMIIALFMSLETILIYNTNEKIDFLQVILFFFIPFMDLFRLFFFRLSISQNPFIGDTNHFHHIVFDISKRFYLVIYIFFLITPCLLFNLLDLNILYCFIISFIFFTILIRLRKSVKVQ